MSVATLAEYEEKVAGMDADAFIGTICWFSIINAKVKHEQLKKLFKQYGLDEKFLPPDLKPVHAYRKATAEIKCDYPTPWAGDGHKARILVREVSHDKGQVERHIVREAVNPSGKKLAYEKLGEARFYRSATGQPGGERIRFQITEPALVHPDEKGILDDLVKRMRSDYHELCTFHDSNAIRGVVRNYVTSLNAIIVRKTGGVYFVHKTRQNEVGALQKFVRELGSAFHLLPLVDTGEQREMLSDAFQTEVEEDVQTLLRDIAAANEKHQDKVPAELFQSLNGRLALLMERAVEYTDLLELTQERAASALELAIASNSEMAERVA